MRVCKACQIVLVGSPGPGRKRVTCSPDCARVWDNAKRRASRARAIVIHHLDRALLAAGEVDQVLWKRLERVRTWVTITDPKIFAKILPRDLETVEARNLITIDQWRERRCDASQNELGQWRQNRLDSIPDPEGER